MLKRANGPSARRAETSSVGELRDGIVYGAARRGNLGFVRT